MLKTTLDNGSNGQQQSPQSQQNQTNQQIAAPRIPDPVQKIPTRAGFNNLTEVNNQLMLQCYQLQSQILALQMEIQQLHNLRQQDQSSAQQKVYLLGERIKEANLRASAAHAEVVALKLFEARDSKAALESLKVQSQSDQQTITKLRTDLKIAETKLDIESKSNAQTIENLNNKLVEKNQTITYLQLELQKDTQIHSNVPTATQLGKRNASALEVNNNRNTKHNNLKVTSPMAASESNTVTVSPPRKKKETNAVNVLRHGLFKEHTHIVNVSINVNQNLNNNGAKQDEAQDFKHP